ncbi:MAG: hypothetical protein EOO73_19775 [Myxococcales bacterium]|nr:MAG: hypothetical protein EOO73_19775 [Myxococcales bacterium]
MTHTDLNQLKRDERGAIMVIGVVAGALLVGALWHIAGIGDAIAWRERAQDAADAAAFENAVWNARGMNVIVAINIVMSVVLAVFIFWRTVMVMVTLALVLGGILCVFTAGLGCGFTAAVARAEMWMVRQDPPFTEKIMRILTAMSAAEVAVATATPIVGLMQSNTNTQGSYAVSNVSTQSASLLPAINVDMADKLMSCFQGKGRYEGKHRKKTKADVAAGIYQDFFRNPRLGIGVSLPMQEESYSALCEKGGAAIGRNAADLIGLLGGSQGFVDGMKAVSDKFGKVVGTLPGIFCAPMGEGKSPEGLTEEIGARAVDACKSELADRVVGDAKDGKYRDDDGKVVTEKEYVSDCKKKKGKAAKDKLQGAFQSKDSGTGYNRTECATPAKVWEWAINGNVFMRSFAQIEKDAPMVDRDAKGLEVADGNRSGNVVAVRTEEVEAHAEIYFDCDKQWMDDCRGDAPWKIGWKARLRRVQPMKRLLTSAIEPGIVATLSRFFEGAGEGANFGLGKIPHFDKFKILAPDVKDTWVYDNITRNYVQKGLFGSGAFDGAGEFVVRNSARNGTLH